MAVTAEKICGIDIAEIKEILKIRLSKKRYTHSINVADAAVKLAEKYKCDAEKAYLAGLIHDICKEIPQDEQLKMALDCGRGFSKIEACIPPLYHSAAGAWYCENVLHIHDEDILNAVRYHTTARANMTRLEEIVYLADLISEERTYKDVDRMRKTANESIEIAMFEAIRFSACNTIGKGSYIPETTFEAYNYYALIMKDKI